MVRTIIHGARMGGSAYRSNFHLIGGGGGQSGQGLLVLRCEIFLMRTLLNKYI